LRQRAGIAPYESSTADTIQGMVERGELPEGAVCAFSGAPTGDVLYLFIVVPRAFEQREGTAGLFLASLWALLFSWWVGGLLTALLPQVFGPTVSVEEAMREHHRARTVPAPLRLASRHHARVRKASQRRLQRLLRTVPIYARLLDENPIVRIWVAPQAAARE
jgi:hypothetical protein